MSYHLSRPRLHDDTEFSLAFRTDDVAFPHGFSLDASNALNFASLDGHGPVPTANMFPNAAVAAPNPLARADRDQGSISSYPVKMYLEQERIDEPWAGTAKFGHGGGITPAINSRQVAFSNYREVPSEYDLEPKEILSDSGYGTGRQSLGNLSVYQDMDRSYETRSLAGNLESFNFEDRSRERRWGGSVTSSSARIPVPLFCRDCNSHVKTKSELKKHEARHHKSHVCDMHPCPRQGEPFGTINDLDRHKKTVHGLNIPGPRYQCTLTPSCSHKAKIWVRADNFRQHLKRVHDTDPSDVDLRLFEIAMPEKRPSQTATTTTVVNSPQSPITRSPLGMDTTDEIWPSLDPATQEDTATIQEEDIRLSASGEVDVGCLEGRSDLIAPDLETKVYKTLKVLGRRSSQLQHAVAGAAQSATLQGQNQEPTVSESSQDHFLLDCAAQQDGDYSASPKCLVAGPDDFDSLMVSDLFSDHAGYYPVSIAENLGEDLGDDLLMSQLPECAMVFQDNDEFVASEFDRATETESNYAPERDQETSSVVDSAASYAHSPLLSNATLVQNPDIDVDDDMKAAPDSTPSSQAEIKFPSSATNWTEHGERSMLYTFLNTIPRGVLQHFIENPAAATLASELPVQSTEPAAHTHSCPDCNKFFNRKCDLTKHVKRHDRPYSCTFRPCKKRFGSKNDWKRHETGQHIDIRVYICEGPYKGDPSGCYRTFPQRKDFEHHLINDHHISDMDKVGDILKRPGSVQRMETWFWCGFCRDNVDAKEGNGVFAERFDHIDNHFFGRNGLVRMEIEEWQMCPNSSLDRERREQDPPAPLNTRKRLLEASPAATQLPPAKKVKKETHGKARKQIFISI